MTPAFKAWFKHSTVVDANGQPLRVFHGTNRDFKRFAKAGSKTHDPDSKNGFFFDENPGIANHFTWEKGSPEGGNIVPVYLAIQHPARALFVLLGGKFNLQKADFFMRQAKIAGHDGAIFQSFVDGLMGVTYVAFDARQVMFALGCQDKYHPQSLDHVNLNQKTVEVENWNMPEYDLLSQSAPAPEA